VLQTERLKILTAAEDQSALVHGLGRRGIRAAVEHRQLGDRTSRPVDAENLFAAADRGLEDADITALHHVESGARVALVEDQFARLIAALHQPRAQKSKLLIRQTGKNRDAPEDRSGFVLHCHGVILRWECNPTWTDVPTRNDC